MIQLHSLCVLTCLLLCPSVCLVLPLQIRYLSVGVFRMLGINPSTSTFPVKREEKRINHIKIFVTIHDLINVEILRLLSVV